MKDERHPKGPWLEEMIAYQGFALHHADRDGVQWTHTIGVHTPGTTTPEFLISGGGHHPLFRVQWLLTLGFAVNGPPSEQALQEEARARHLPIEHRSYPPGGKIFSPGRRYALTEGDVRVCFGEVHKRYYPSFLIHALQYHGGGDFPVLQLVVSNEQGMFPWDPGALPGFAWQGQQVLFDPTPYLPLQEEQQ